MPLLAKAADRLLADERFQGLRDQLAAWRRAHPWIEDSALFEVRIASEALQPLAHDVS